jgi:hypothetical protein
MEPRLKNNELVAKVQKQLLEIRPLISESADISQKSVEQIRSITGDLIQSITTKEQ